MLYREAPLVSEDNDLEFCLSDETVDRYGDVILASGWDLSSFARNPVCLLNHDKMSIVGGWTNVRVAAKRLLGRLRLADAGTSPLVDYVRALVKQRYLRAVSVGFAPIKKEPLDKDGDDAFGPFRYLKSELVECSLVAVGANRNAVQLAKEFGLDERQQALVERPSFRDDRESASATAQLARDVAEVKKIAISLAAANRVERKPPKPKPTVRELLAKVAVCHLLATLRDRRHPQVARVAAEVYTNDEPLLRALATPGLIVRNGLARPTLARAVTNPAMTTTPTWAQELIGQTNSSFAELAAPSAYSHLTTHGLRLNLASVGYGRLISRTPGEMSGSFFVQEGKPKPVRRLTFAGNQLTPHGGGFISVITDELEQYSTPDAERVVGEAMQADTATAIDRALLDNGAASTIRPAGLLNGVTAIPGSDSGDPQVDIGTDLAAAFAAITAPIADPVVLLNPVTAMRAASLLPALSVVFSPSVPAEALIALDAADFASAEGDELRLDVSDQAALDMEDPATDGSLLTGASVVSLWQMNLVGLRVSGQVTWAMRRSGRVAEVSPVNW